MYESVDWQGVNLCAVRKITNDFAQKSMVPQILIPRIGSSFLKSNNISVLNNVSGNATFATLNITSTNISDRFIINCYKIILVEYFLELFIMQRNHKTLVDWTARGRNIFEEWLFLK